MTNSSAMMDFELVGQVEFLISIASQSARLKIVWTQPLLPAHDCHRAVWPASSSMVPMNSKQDSIKLWKRNSEGGRPFCSPASYKPNNRCEWTKLKVRRSRPQPARLVPLLALLPIVCVLLLSGLASAQLEANKTIAPAGQEQNWRWPKTAMTTTTTKGARSKQIGAIEMAYASGGKLVVSKQGEKSPISSASFGDFAAPTPSLESKGKKPNKRLVANATTTTNGDSLSFELADILDQHHDLDHHQHPINSTRSQQDNDFERVLIGVEARNRLASGPLEANKQLGRHLQLGQVVSNQIDAKVDDKNNQPEAQVKSNGKRPTPLGRLSNPIKTSALLQADARDCLRGISRECAKVARRRRRAAQTHILERDDANANTQYQAPADANSSAPHCAVCASKPAKGYEKSGTSLKRNANEVEHSIRQSSESMVRQIGQASLRPTAKENKSIGAKCKEAARLGGGKTINHFPEASSYSKEGANSSSLSNNKKEEKEIVASLEVENSIEVGGEFSLSSRRRRQTESESASSSSFRQFGENKLKVIVLGASETLKRQVESGKRLRRATSNYLASETSGLQRVGAAASKRQSDWQVAAFEDDQAQADLLKLLADFYAHTRILNRQVEETTRRTLEALRQQNVTGASRGQVGVRNNLQQQQQQQQKEQQKVESGAQPEGGKQNDIEKVDWQSGAQLNERELKRRLEMVLGASEDGLLRWLSLRRERFDSLKNVTFELIQERPNRTINICPDGPKILILPNITDVAYCYTHDQWIERLWSGLRFSAFHYPIILLNLLIFLVGTTGNIFVCLSVKRNHQLRSVTNYFIVNLAFADFLVILICLPATVVWDLSLTWFFDTIPCKLIMFLQDVSISVSVLTLTAISIDRYYAICHPLKFKSNLSQAKRMIALIWLVSLAIMTPDLIYLRAKPSEDLSEAGLKTVLYSDCNYNWSNEASRAFQFVKTILLYLIPFLLMFCAHYRILQVLRLASSMMAAEPTINGSPTCAQLATPPPPPQTQFPVARQPLAMASNNKSEVSCVTRVELIELNGPNPVDVDVVDSPAQLIKSQEVERHSSGKHKRHHKHKCRHSSNLERHAETHGVEVGELKATRQNHHRRRKKRSERKQSSRKLSSCEMQSESSVTNTTSSTCEACPHEQVGVAVAKNSQATTVSPTESSCCIEIGASCLESAQPEPTDVSQRDRKCEDKKMKTTREPNETSADLELSARQVRFGESASCDSGPRRTSATAANSATSSQVVDEQQQQQQLEQQERSEYLKRQRMLQELLLERHDSFEQPPGERRSSAARRLSNLVMGNLGDTGTRNGGAMGVCSNWTAASASRLRLIAGCLKRPLGFRTRLNRTKRRAATERMTPVEGELARLDELPELTEGRTNVTLLDAPTPPPPPPQLETSRSAANGHAAPTSTSPASSGSLLDAKKRKLRTSLAGASTRTRALVAAAAAAAAANGPERAGPSKIPIPMTTFNADSTANVFVLTMHNKSKLESRRKAAKMLTAIVVLFGICYLPVHLINFLRQFIEDIPQTDVTSTISMLSHCVCYLNSAINPIIYNHMNSVFRAEFRKFLSCLDWRKSSAQPAVATRASAYQAHQQHQQQQLANHEHNPSNFAPNRTTTGRPGEASKSHLHELKQVKQVKQQQLNQQAEGP